MVWTPDFPERLGCQAQWSVFDLGPFGIGHQHNDKLHLSIHAHGRDLLVDSGRYTYQNYNSTDRRDMRGYVRRSWGHNVILVDHQSQNDDDHEVEAPHADWSIQDAYDFGIQTFDKGWYTGIEGQHTRAMFYLRNHYWIVIDFIDLHKPARIQALWHFHPECSVETGSDKQAWTGDEGRANLRITPVFQSGEDWSLELVKGQSEPYYQGWYSPVQNVVQPSYCAVYERGVEDSAVFAWVLTTADGEAPQIEARFLVTDGESVCLEVTDRQGNRTEVRVNRADGSGILIQ